MVETEAEWSQPAQAAAYLVLVLQLPSGAAELEGAPEPQSPVRIRQLMPFRETEPLGLGAEEVSGICLAP